MRRPSLFSTIATVTVLLLTIVMTGCSKKSSRPVTDSDGNTYGTVTIGGAVWMTENLKVTRYRNGDPVPEVQDGAAWALLATGARSSYDNKLENTGSMGMLYNWYAVTDPRGIAPEGWHVATDEEWSDLVSACGGESQAAKALKSPDQWEGQAADPESGNGFNARPSGARRDSDGVFVLRGQFARFWSATSAENGKGWGRAMEFYDNAVRRGQVGPKNAFSVRCVKD